MTGVADDHEALHRDLLRGVTGGLAAAGLALGLAGATGGPHDQVLDGPALAYAAGWGLGTAAACTVGAAVMRRAGLVAGALATAAAAPLAWLGGRYLVHLAEHGRVDLATSALLDERPASLGIALAVHALAGLLVLAPLLAARRRGAGVAGQLAASLGGGLALAVVLGVASLRGAEVFGVGSSRDAALQLSGILLSLSLAGRAVDAVLARRASGTVARTVCSRRGPGEALALGCAALAWVAVAAERGPPLDAALRLLPWPRDPAWLDQLGGQIDPDALGVGWIDATQLCCTPGPVHLRNVDADPRRRWALSLAFRRRAARAGHLPAMRSLSEALLSAVRAHTAASRRLRDDGWIFGEPRIAARDAPALEREALDWLRRVAAVGTPHDRRTLAMHEPGIAPREALEALLRDVAFDDTPSVFLAADRIALATPAERRAILHALQRLAWRRDPPDLMCIVGRWHRAHGEPVRPPGVDAVRRLLELAPRAERTTWETLAIARGDEEPVLAERSRRLADGRFTLADDRWLPRSRVRFRAPLPRPGDALRALPPATSVRPALRAEMARALAAARARRLLEAWTLLDDLARREPGEAAPRLARALVYAELAQARPPLRWPHVDAMRALAARAEPDDLAPSLLAAHAAVQGWWGLAHGDRGAIAAAVDRLRHASRCSPADLRLPIRRVALEARAAALLPSSLQAQRTGVRTFGEHARLQGDARRAAGDLDGAAVLYRLATAWSPGDLAGRRSLRDIARDRGDAGTLAEAEARLAGAGDGSAHAPR